MMKPTMQAANLMGVIVVVPVSIQRYVQIVCVMKEVHRHLIHHVSFMLLQANLDLRNPIFSFLNQELFDLRKKYVLKLKNSRHKIFLCR